MPVIPLLNLSGKHPNDTFQYLVTSDGVNLANGTGSQITASNITASYSVSSSFALTSSYEFISVFAMTSSFSTQSLSASYALTSSLVKDLFTTNNIPVFGGYSNIEKIPFRAQVGSDQTTAQNVIDYMNTLRPMGYNIMYADTAHFYTKRTGSHLAFNTTNFPTGSTGYRNMLHNNGYRWFIWYDATNAAPGDPAIDDAQYIDDLKTIISWAPDIVWVDEHGRRAELAVQLFASSSLTAPQLMTGVVNTDGLSHTSQINSTNLWRLHGTSDLVSWNVFCEYADAIERNDWKYVGPGSYFFLGPELATLGNATEVHSAMTLASMWSCPVVFPFQNYSQSYGDPTFVTSKTFLDIQGDSAVVCARRVLTTGSLWCYLKPLGNANGPNFALCVVNSGSTTQSINIPLRKLNGIQSSAGTLQSATSSLPSYTIYDLKNSSLVSSYDSSSIQITNLTPHDYALYHLIANVPTSQQPQTTWYTPGMLDVATSAGWTRITHEDFQGPFGPTSYYARDGWYLGGSVGAFLYMTIPDWCSSVTVDTWVGCDTNNTTWTISTTGASHLDPVNGYIADLIVVGTGTIPITMSNSGIRLVSYVATGNPVPNQGPRYLTEFWSTANSGSAKRMILGSRKLTFK